MITTVKTHSSLQKILSDKHEDAELERTEQN